MGTGPLAVEPYISAEFFEKEREKIFRRAWLEVARTEELPNAGDYVVREIEVLKTSILLVRGKDGVVRGFHNVCTHRGMAVAICDKGNAQGFICNFHGRSEEHTSELQSLMRISYAVFCLKKKSKSQT